MEFNSSTAITTLGISKKKKKRRGGPGHFFRVALYMLKQAKSQKKNVTDVNSDSLWKRFVGPMRPLYVQNHPSPPLLTEGFPPSPVAEVFTPPMSPAPAGMSVCSSSGDMSQYASALNLQELDQDQTDEIEHDWGDDQQGDDMIDAKAELFIAQFYHEIQVQNQAYHCRNKGSN